MGSRKPPLAATISGVVLSLNGVDSPTQAINIPNYSGENLFCHVDTSADLLIITINGEPPNNDNQASADATQALVIVTYRDVHVPPFTLPGITYAAGTSLSLRLMVSSDLTDALLTITDAGPPQNGNVARLEFVLVHEESPDEPRYRLEWIQNPIMVDFAAFRTEASVIEPSAVVGGAMGPMGLATP